MSAPEKWLIEATTGEHEKGTFRVLTIGEGTNGTGDGPARVVLHIGDYGQGLNEEDAHKVIAAPDLLEALRAVEWSREVRGYAHRTCPLCLNDSEQRHEPDCLVGAAIAKAEGRS